MGKYVGKLVAPLEMANLGERKKKKRNGGRGAENILKVSYVKQWRYECTVTHKRENINDLNYKIDSSFLI